MVRCPASVAGSPGCSSSAEGSPPPRRCSPCERSPGTASTCSSRLGPGPDLQADDRRRGVHRRARRAEGDAAPLFDLRRLCQDTDAQLTVGRLAAVCAARREISLTDGRTLPYDALVVACGARSERWLPEAIAAHRPRRHRPDGGHARPLDGERVDSVAFVVPTGTGWTLPAYELALLTARRAADAGCAPHLHLITPEPEPLAAFGGAPSRETAALLAESGVALRVRTHALDHRDGRLLVAPDAPEAIAVDRVVALPRLVGPRIVGLACDTEGFVPADAHGAVGGLEDVYVAGDITAGPVHQGGLSAQQADAVAAAIASRAGAGVEATPYRPVLCGVMLTGRAPRYLRADLHPGPRNGPAEISEHPLWWPPAKIAARHLGPYLAALEHETRPAAHGRLETVVDPYRATATSGATPPNEVITT